MDGQRRRPELLRSFREAYLDNSGHRSRNESLESTVTRVVNINNDTKLSEFTETTIFLTINYNIACLENLFGTQVITARERDVMSEKITAEVSQKFAQSSIMYDTVEKFITEKTANATDSILVDKLKEQHLTNNENLFKHKPYYSRLELTTQHSLSAQRVEELFRENHKSLDSDVIKNLVNDLIKNADKSLEKLLTENHERRDSVKKKIEDETRKLYAKTMNDNLRSNFFDVDRFDGLSSRCKNEALNKFQTSCDEDCDLNFCRSKVLRLIELEEIKLKSEHELLLNEAKAKNSDTINRCVTYYRDQMNAMRTFVDSFHGDVEQFDVWHGVCLTNAKQSFRKQCTIQEESYLSDQIVKLEREIETLYVDLRSRLNNNIRHFEKTIKELIISGQQSYIKVMKESIKVDGFHSADELESLNSKTSANTISHFESQVRAQFANIDDVKLIEHKVELLSLITHEFDRIKADNDTNQRRIETNLTELAKTLTDKYEKEIESVVNRCQSVEELRAHHCGLERSIRCQFSAAFVGGKADHFRAHTTTLADSLGLAFKEAKKILQMKIEARDKKVRNLVINACKYYRQEMREYFEKTNTDYISTGNLRQCHRSAAGRTLAAFTASVERSELERVRQEIESSLSRTYAELSKQNAMHAPTVPAIGIDLGTTNSCVAYFQTGKPCGKVVIIPNEFGDQTTPSVVAFGDNNEEIVGKAAKQKAYANPRNTIYSVKRLIGRRFNEEVVKADAKRWPFEVIEGADNKPAIRVRVDGEHHDYCAEEISAKVLKKLKETAVKHLKLPVKKAVITVPAYFNDAQKEATIDAGKIAGLEILKIINEPTAAAIAFRMDECGHKNERKVLIYDLGGGTFDVAVVQINAGNIEVKAVSGDNHLGGDDIDANLIDYCLQEFYDETGVQVDRDTDEGERAIRRLLTLSEEKKWILSTHTSVYILLDNFYGGHDLELIVSRQRFEDINKDLFDKTIDIVKKALADAGLSRADIDDIVLVGGSTRIPKIRQLLSELFVGKELNESVNADEAVAVGAAYQAAVLNGVQSEGLDSLQLSDVAPISLGVRVKDGLMFVMVARNSKVPTQVERRFATTTDNQTEIDVEVYEGEQVLVTDNRKLGVFRVMNIPAAKAGVQCVDVMFDIDAEGILHVRARLLSDGRETAITVSEHKGRLGEQQLRQLIELEHVQRTGCRFCGEHENTNRLEIGFVCAKSECETLAAKACLNRLDCGHLCAGIAGENCLPCLQSDCTGGADQFGQNGEDMCMICMESLLWAPIIKLDCGHLFHYHCCEAVLKNRWPGPRIAFAFSLCAICKHRISHPSLAPLLTPINALYADVRRKAITRLKYDGMLTCEAVTTPGRVFFNDSAGYAMDRYTYYVCFKCKAAYFGGEARCEAAAADQEDGFNPEELICAACADGPRAQNCPQHGTDFLQYKCRYCCSIATFFCHGNTHYCTPCHGRAPNPVPNCPAGPRGQQLVGVECPLRVRHPPTGTEFSLGCGLCLNAQSF